MAEGGNVDESPFHQSQPFDKLVERESRKTSLMDSIDDNSTNSLSPIQEQQPYDQVFKYEHYKNAHHHATSGIDGRRISQAMMHQVMKGAKKYSTAELRENNHLITQVITRKHEKTRRLTLSSTERLKKFRLAASLHPNSTFRACWDIGLILLLCYTAIAVPAQIAFIRNEQTTDPVFIWDTIVDVFFLVDMSFNFFTPFVDKETNQVIEHPVLIFQHYIYGWFALDFFSVFPYNLVATTLELNSNTQAVNTLKLIRVFRILKLARVFRASRILARWNAVLGLPIALSQLGKYALFMTILAHWMACVWAIVPQFEVDDVNDWMSAYSNSFNCNDSTSQYITALYWSVMTIGTIGYGDVPMATTLEKIIAIICMTIGCGAYSFIVGSVCGLVSSLDESSTEFNQQMDHLNVYMGKESIPRNMTFRLREYFLHSRDLVLHKHFARVLGHLSPGLRGVLSVFTAGEWIQMVHFMVGGPSGEHVRFITAICQKMDAELYPPQELIIRSGETTNKMYIISKGLVARNGRILHKGNFFGEDVIMKSIETTMIFDTRTLTYCDTYTLTRSSIDSILATGSFPYKQKTIRRAAAFMALTRRLKMLYIQLVAIKSVGNLTMDEQRAWVRLRLLGDNAMGLHPNAHLAAAVSCISSCMHSMENAKAIDINTLLLVGCTVESTTSMEKLGTAKQVISAGPTLRSRAFWRKSLALLQDEIGHDTHVRSLTIFDLLMIGIGGTVGSGVFATAGLIARCYAGPAAILSWMLAGFGCVLTGCAFMELAGLIPTHGSTYAYTYHALGEYPAVIAGFLLTLEYGVACAGNARAWSSKFIVWLKLMFNIDSPSWIRPANTSIDLYACFIMTLCVLIVLCGMQVGKRLINVITMTKITVVLFIIIAGLTKFQYEHLDPFIPPQELDPQTGQTVFGWPGVMLGASASFYGYIGYDEVCCLAGDAINPRKNIPRAVLGTVVGAGVLSILATLSVVGMQRYQFIDAQESYGEAFKSVGYLWASPIVETGEVLTMPVGILIGFLAQPRVQCAMANDGLLPSIFGRLDSTGNPRIGASICGIVLITLATFVEFQILWNFISLGILLAFNMTNLSLLVVRYGTSQIRVKKEGTFTFQLNFILFLFGLTSFLSALHWQHGTISPIVVPANSSNIYATYMNTAGVYVAIFLTLLMMSLVFLLARNHPNHYEDEDLGEEGKGLFRCPWVPLVPCVAIFFNWLLVVQMPWTTVAMMFAWIAIATVVYIGYGIHHGLATTSLYL